MAKKKKGELTLSRRGKEKLKLALRHFDLTMLTYMVIVLVCSWVGGIGSYDLSRGNLNGFALWFLLIPAYLPLELLGFFSWMLHWEWNFAGHEALLLGCCDLILALLVWLFIRFFGRVRGILFVRTARVFVMIFVCWGIFQLLCIAALWTWHNGGFHSLHRHLHRSEKTVNFQTSQAVPQEKP